MNMDFFYKWHNTVLKKQTSEVDVDAIWASIESEVDVINAERKRRRGFLFFLFGLCIMILGLGYMRLFAPDLGTPNAHIAKTSYVNTTVPVKEGTQIDNHIMEEVQFENNTIANKASITQSPASKTHTSTFIPSEISSSSKKFNDANIQKKTRKLSAPIATPKVRIDNYVNNGLTNTVEPSLDKNTSTPSNYLHQSYLDENQEDLKQGRLLAIDPIAVNYSITLLEEEEETPPSAQEIIIAKQNPFQFSVQVYSGIGFVNRTLSVKEGQEADEILLLRSATEKSLEVLNNGIKVGLTHKGGLNASIGFQYARVAERFQYDTRFLQLDSTANQVIGQSNNLLGTRNTIIGYAPNNTIHDLEYDFYNNYHFIEIPISLGFQKRVSSWDIGLRVSYIQNLSLRTKGRVLNSSFEVVNTTQENDLFRNSLNVSFEGGANVNYNFTPHIAVGLEAFYRYLPQSITKTEYALDQRYNWIGLNASLKYSF